MQKKVIELIRVSTELQAAEDRAGIPAQRAINRKTAIAYGLEIVRSIEITDVSGAAVLYAPEMQQLLKEIQSSEIHGVVAREFSRLMRPENYADYGLLQAFVDSNTILYLPEGPIDFSNKSGRILGTIRATLAGIERTEMLERMFAGKEERRRNGKLAQSKSSLPTGVGYTEEQGFFFTADAEKVKEAFRIFLSGNTSYSDIGRLIGINKFTVRSILQNPIYTGWRVIDKKRDTSPSARRVRKDGRQGERPKIKRAPDEIIRVKVIEEPIISESDFNQVQILIAAKKKNHWRTKPNHLTRFTYGGFLFCASCSAPVYTKLAHGDYYVCKSRWFSKGCKTCFMRRDRVERELDTLFSDRLTKIDFLEQVASTMASSEDIQTQKARFDRLSSQLENLNNKRSRILDTYIDGLINQQERDARLKSIDAELTFIQDALRRETRPVLSAKLLTQVFSIFYEFAFLNLQDKKRLLSTIAREIRISNYFIEGIDFSLPFFDGDKSVHKSADARNESTL